MGTAKHRIDRRVARTRAALHRALISLILEKGYDLITVEEICHAANVGRSTFYLHYTGKDDLKQHGLDGLRRQLAEAAARAGRGGTFGFSLPMFEHAHDHIDLYRALAGSRGGTVALGTIRQILSDLVRDDLAANSGKHISDAIPRELVVQYVVGAFMAALTWWLDGGATLPPHRIDAMFRRLMSEGAMQARP
ncbi:TetR/AcrR family transcriptional regulator [Rhizobium laguerreae]|uniref:TetR/AcrR family transcriptional regulator n=1 Tax=Rhizobium laguerreae TaxID=1076926 RepID=UPI00103FA013|nr:TetR/AcrR family transcriptional regulator [Rhizobium laguerreae]MBY3225389.1 TetR/AcrR family transcriptional regulator [Rhizobium laguerreae]MBY3237784.1 TetR/AcrR family transcriptional regulator [Rhizobium laguerreae]NKM25503.1 TetR family transcriptional regulator [Rhizobium laguerreae]TBY06883.1 TetR/AcrR family transcriptional regulator [Rhizobium laguerreae]